ncbi:MAG: hypothetical protein ACTSO9_00110 [Candidatus Helarchaeota archaeon]
MEKNNHRLVFLCILATFMFIGTSLYIPTLQNSKNLNKVGESPTNLDNSLQSSFTQDFSGTSSNIGIMGYTNGTKQGTINDNEALWWVENSNRGSYFRAANIPYPIPISTEAPWHVVGVYATISNFKATHNFVKDSDFTQGLWNYEYISSESRYSNALSMNAGSGTNNLIYNGQIGTLSTSANNYFNGKSGIKFDVGSNRLAVNDYLTGSSGISENTQNPTISYSQSSEAYFTRTGFWFTDYNKRIGPLAWASFGYRGVSSEYKSYDNVFGHDGDYRSPEWFDPDAGHGDGVHGTQFKSSYYRNPSTGKIDIDSEFWVYASIGYRRSDKGNIDLYLTTKWNDYASQKTIVEKEISWVDDGSPPDSIHVYYTLSYDSSKSGYTYSWVDSRSYKSFTHTGSGYIKVEVDLVNPYGTVVASRPDKYFGYGDYSSYGTSSQSVNWDITNNLYYTGSINKWKIRITVTQYLKNYGNCNNKHVCHHGSDTPWDDSDTCEETIELQNYAKIGLDISNFRVYWQDDRPWDDDPSTPNQYHDVYYHHQNINFGGSTISENDHPIIGFDWFVPPGVDGHDVDGSVDPYHGLHAQPFALIKWNGGSQSQYLFDTETFYDVKDRPASAVQSQYPWLAEGDPNQKGGDHFDIDWAAGALLLSGTSDIDIYVGFRFYDDFCTDYDIGTTDVTLFITNVTFTVKASTNPQFVGTQLVWDKDGSGSSLNYLATNVIGTGIGTGYIDNMDLSTYHSTNGKMFYWRVDDKTRSAYIEWSITLKLEYEYWGYTTTYKITSGGTVEFYANFTMPIPYNEGFSDSYKNNFWFDLIFPRYQMIASGEPYWDLIYAFEDTYPQNAQDIKYGEEDLGTALNSKGSLIAVFENKTDPYGIGDTYADSKYLGTLDQYHQFARFHHVLFDQWLSQNNLNWNILFRAPNYLSNIILDKESDFASPDSVYYAGETVKVKGTFSTPAIDVIGTRGDIGDIGIKWFEPNSRNLMAGTGNNPTSIVVTSSSTSVQVTDSLTILSATPPNEGYWAAIEYIDENTCGDSYTSGDYCSGIFRLGYISQNFTVKRTSYIQQSELKFYEQKSGSLIELPLSTDNVPIYDTLTMDNPLLLMVTWHDGATNLPLSGGNASITISSWVLDPNNKERKIAQNVEPWIDAPMIDLNNGSYICYIDPEYLGHSLGDGPNDANITQGFHNFTISISKPGYDSASIEGNFSIVVDTVMTILTPAHNLIENSSYNPTQFGRPHFDDSNCFATNNYTFRVWLKENKTNGNSFYNSTNTFYNSMMRVRYQLVGYANETTGKIIRMSDPEFKYFINWTWFDQNKDQYSDGNNTVFNGTMTTSDGTIFFASVRWFSFADTADKGMPAYSIDVHVYYNITIEVLTNRTTYTPDHYFQPNDVKIQYCEDNPEDSFYNDFTIEEILGMRIQVQGSDNQTYVYLMYDDSLDNSDTAFGLGKYQPNSYDHNFEDFEIVNYWYNSTNDKFRLRVRFNCTTAGDPYLGATYKVPPCGPLNHSTWHYGINYTWSGPTNIYLSGWNDSDIPFSYDDQHLWSTEVNQSEGNPFTAYGETYVSPWLSFRDIPSTSLEPEGFKWIHIYAKKPGFVDDVIHIKLYVMDQKTKLMNATDHSTIDLDHPITLETPTGIPKWFYVQYNDTTNDVNGINVGIENASIEVLSDNWVGHYKNGYGSTWEYKSLGNGLYLINLTNTEKQVVDGPEFINITMRISKGNYSAVDFRVYLNIRKHDTQIVYLGGKSEGYYLPSYVIANYTQIGHINLTYQILDLDNNSVPILFSQDEIRDNFYFTRTDTSEYLITHVDIKQNSSGIFYYVIIQTHIDLNDPAHPDYLDLTVNFSINNLINYESTYIETPIRIDAIPLTTQWRTPSTIDVEYLWPDYSAWVDDCPKFELNLTDMIHFAYYDLPTDINDFESYYSSFNNPYQNGINSINPGSDNEDIFIRPMYTTDSLGRSYQYLQIIIDTRGISVQDGLNINIEIKKPNYENISLNLVVNIKNASTYIPNNAIDISIMDTYDKTQNQTIDWDSAAWITYLNPNSVNPSQEEIVIPWGNLFAIKCRYMSKLLVINDSTGGAGNVQMTILDLPPELYSVLFYYKDSVTSEFYFYFWAEPSNIEAFNQNITIALWKNNFAPAFYRINITIRPRNTQLIYPPQELIKTVMWRETAQFTVQYLDLDYSDQQNNGIQNAVINGTPRNAIGAPFDLGNGLYAYWNFSESSDGRYDIWVNTSKLMARSEPYFLTFNITKLGVNDLQPHWQPILFTINLTITPLQLKVEHFFMTSPEEIDSTPAREYEEGKDMFALSIDPENKFMLVYLKIYYDVNEYGTIHRYYLTNDSEFSISVNYKVYDWNGEYMNEESQANVLTGGAFYFQEFIEHAESFKGYWICQINFDLFNKDDQYPYEVHMQLYNGIVITITPENNNIQQKTTKWSFMVSRIIEFPIWFYILVTAIGAVGISLGTWGVRKIFQLRIPYVLRMIDETIDKINKDKFPEIGVMLGRSEFVINMVIEYLDMCGIEWEIKDKIEMEESEEEEEGERLPPLTHDELVVELNKIQSLTPDERMLFLEELRELSRKEQIEFLKSLEED